jgi:hypothetical protein
MKGTTKGPALDFGSINSTSMILVLRVSLEKVASSVTEASRTSLDYNLLAIIVLLRFPVYNSAFSVAGRFLLPLRTMTEGWFTCSSIHSFSSIFEFLRLSERLT